MNQLSQMTREDEAARERLEAATAAMQARTCAWSDVNTGSWNTDGLKAFSGELANAFAELKGDIRLQEAPGFETIEFVGEIRDHLYRPHCPRFRAAFCAHPGCDDRSLRHRLPKGNI